MKTFAERTLSKLQSNRLAARSQKRREVLIFARKTFFIFLVLFLVVRIIIVITDMSDEKERAKEALSKKNCRVPRGTDISNLACKDGEVVDKRTGEKFIIEPKKMTIRGEYGYQ